MISFTKFKVDGFCCSCGAEEVLIFPSHTLGNAQGTSHEQGSYRSTGRIVGNEKAWVNHPTGSDQGDAMEMCIRFAR